LKMQVRSLTVIVSEHRRTSVSAGRMTLFIL
jgi:hypothetical protein